MEQVTDSKTEPERLVVHGIEFPILLTFPDHGGLRFECQGCGWDMIYAGSLRQDGIDAAIFHADRCPDLPKTRDF